MAEYCIFLRVWQSTDALVIQTPIVLFGACMHFTGSIVEKALPFVDSPFPCPKNTVYCLENGKEGLSSTAWRPSPQGLDMQHSANCSACEVVC